MSNSYWSVKNAGFSENYAVQWSRPAVEMPICFQDVPSTRSQLDRVVKPANLSKFAFMPLLLPFTFSLCLWPIWRHLPHHEDVRRK